MTEVFGPEALSITLRERRRAEISNLLAPKRAAVAITLRSGAQGPEVLLMQRVERAGDRWSGQVSFPGGKPNPKTPLCSTPRCGRWAKRSGSGWMKTP